MDNDEFKREVIALLTRIACVLETRSAVPIKATSPRSAAPAKKAARSRSGGDEQTVGDYVGDTCDWGETLMPFGKHKGKSLRDVPVGYIQWLAPNWEHQGYDNDDAMQSCIAAVTGGSTGSSQPEPQEATSAPPQEDFGDVPF